MANERKFIRENSKRSLIKKFLVKEIEGSGFGGMNIQRTPIGTRVNILVERPGMVIGKSGVKIKELTDTIRTKFNVDNKGIFPITYVVNAQGQVASMFTGIAEAKSLVDAAKKKVSSGCCPPGSGKTCGPTKK